MDIIRTIKLKKLNGDFDAMSNREEYLLSIFSNTIQYEKAFYIFIEKVNRVSVCRYNIFNYQLFLNPEIWSKYKNTFNIDTVDDTKFEIDKIFKRILPELKISDVRLLTPD